MQRENVKKRKSKKKSSRFLMSSCLFAISIFLFYQIAIEVSNMFALKKDIANSTDTLNEIKEEKESLEKEKDNLQDPNFVENYARGKYMATKDGEQVFILPDDN